MNTETNNQDQFPLYPRLGEEGEKEAQELIDRFKGKIRTAIDDVLGELYCDVAVYIESDSWTNFRNEMMAGYKNYGNRKIQAHYDFKEIRQSILKNHREEIIEDLNQDLLEEVERLKAVISSIEYH
jgi:hypothetical protein